MSVLSKDDCEYINTILERLDFKLSNAEQAIRIHSILQNFIDDKGDISIANKDGKVKEVK